MEDNQNGRQPKWNTWHGIRMLFGTGWFGWGWVGGCIQVLKVCPGAIELIDSRRLGIHATLPLLL